MAAFIPSKDTAGPPAKGEAGGRTGGGDFQLQQAGSYVASQSVGPLRLADRAPFRAQPPTQSRSMVPEGPLPAFRRGCLAPPRGRGSEGKGRLSSAALREDTQESHSPPTGQSFIPSFTGSPVPSFIHTFVRSADSRKIFLCGLEHVSRPCWAVMAPVCPGTLTSATG